MSRIIQLKGGESESVVIAVEMNDIWRSLTSFVGLTLTAMLVLALGAVMIAMRLGRSILRPIEDLTRAAQSASEGDLATRVVPTGNPKIKNLGQSFNKLVSRVQDLIARERESTADLSHRLRSPLTVLMLQAESLSDPEESDMILSSAKRLASDLDEVILSLRKLPDNRPVTTDLGKVVAECLEYWAPVLRREDRPYTRHLADTPMTVALGAREVRELTDVLVDNVLKHTPRGCDIAIETKSAPGGNAVLIVEDSGPGIGNVRMVDRGRSGVGSSGLGLDIARRTASVAGGSFRIGVSKMGGARVEISLPQVPPASNA